MADLINVEQFTWRTEALEEIFDNDQTDRILIIPVMRTNIKDAKIWSGDNIGKYSARGGYK